MNTIRLPATLLFGDADIDLELDIEYDKTDEGILVMEVYFNGSRMILFREDMERIELEIQQFLGE